MSFSTHVRRLRLEQPNLSLRALAAKTGIEFSYLSRIERGEADPPANDKIITLAAALGEDPDVLLMMAGRIPPDVLAIIQDHPREFVDLVRQLRGAPPERIATVTKQVRDGKW